MFASSPNHASASSAAAAPWWPQNEPYPRDGSDVHGARRRARSVDGDSGRPRAHRPNLLIAVSRAPPELCRFDRLHMQRRFGCSGAEALLGSWKAWSTGSRNVAIAIVRCTPAREEKESSRWPTPRDRIPSKAITPGEQAGRSLLGKAITRDDWRVVPSGRLRCRHSARPTRALRADECDSPTEGRRAPPETGSRGATCRLRWLSSNTRARRRRRGWGAAQLVAGRAAGTARRPRRPHRPHLRVRGA